MELTLTETTAMNDTTKPAATEAGPTPSFGKRSFHSMDRSRPKRSSRTS
jgi:hypothetical protein